MMRQKIFAFKHRIHIFQGLKLLFVRRALPIPAGKWSLTFEMEFASKAGFEDVSSSEMFRVVQYVSMTFDVEFRSLSSHSQLTEERKNKNQLSSIPLQSSQRHHGSFVKSF